MDLRRMIAQRAASLEASGIRKIFDLAATLKDPVNLSIGQPDFPVPDAVKEAAKSAISGDKNGYTPSGGIPELRAAIQARYEKNQGVTPEDVVITSGVSGALTVALMSLVNPGDEVLVPDPYFVSYRHLTTLCGGRPVFYDTYPDWRVKEAALERAVTSKTKVVLAMSPGNPTGACLDDSEKKILASFARKHNLVVISDEIYELFSYGKGIGKSLITFYPEGSLAVGGLSKTVSVTGWRVGWAAGPKELIQEMTKIQQFTFVCAPSFAQYAALAALDVDCTPVVSEYRKKRDRMLRELRRVGYELSEPGGAFYLFPKVPEAYTCGEQFVERAASKSLLMVPGGVFSERDTHFRISYAASDEKLEEGLSILAAMKKST